MDSAALPTSKAKHKFCFICFGNICRSPALSCIFEHLAKKRGVWDQFYVDSMALTTYYVGKPVDARMCKAAQKKHIVLEHTAQLFKPGDFERFDIIFAVTNEAADLLKDLAPTDAQAQKIKLATAYSRKFLSQDIPDPYYDGSQAFDHVMDMALDCCEGLLDHFC